MGSACCPPGMAWHGMAWCRPCRCEGAGHAFDKHWCARHGRLALPGAAACALLHNRSLALHADAHEGGVGVDVSLDAAAAQRDHSNTANAVKTCKPGRALHALISIPGCLFQHRMRKEACSTQLSTHSFCRRAKATGGLPCPHAHLRISPTSSRARRSCWWLPHCKRWRGAGRSGLVQRCYKGYKGYKQGLYRMPSRQRQHAFVGI